MGAKNRRLRSLREAHATDPLRTRIATLAARLMAEEGVGDYAAAKRKALSRLNLPEARHLPSNREIEAALREHLALFHGRKLTERLQRLRRVAAQAMRFLERFAPRLTGPALSGTVTSASEIQLHVSAETPEEIGLWLQEHSIPFAQAERRLRFGGDRYEVLPCFRFTADAQPIELVVFTPRQAREPPLSPVDGRPMPRASLKEVEQLLRAADGVGDSPAAEEPACPQAPHTPHVQAERKK